MISVVIFSKDRACQLDLLLRSMAINMIDVPGVTVLYTSSSRQFQDGYDKLASKFPQHRWVRESDFRKDLLRIYASATNEYVLNLVDDEVVVSPIGLSRFVDLMGKNGDAIHCASLRMHPGVDYTYTWGLHSPPSNLSRIVGLDDYYLLDWSRNDVRTDWGFPSCINSHIYHRDVFVKAVNGLQFRTVNEMEIVFHGQRRTFKRYMLLHKFPKTASIANNKVQLGGSRHGSNDEYSVENLNRLFLGGSIIDGSDFTDLTFHMATFEHGYRFVGSGG